MTETTKRIIELKNKNGLNDHQLELNVGLPVSSIQAWTKGKKRKDGTVAETAPSLDTIVKLARYFNVSADYLLCLTDKPTPLKQSDIAERTTTALSIELAELSHDENFINVAKLYKAMPQGDKRGIYAYVCGLAQGIGLNIQQILRS